MIYADVCRAAGARQLDVLGGFHPKPDGGLPADVRTLVLLGPREPGFWPYFQSTPEVLDGASDPLDRWSTRVVGDLAAQLGGTAFFPFGGPPYHPFFSWAQRSGRCHASPIMLLVHDVAGLMVSFRGAIGLPMTIDLPQPPPNPCDTCSARACVTSCPVSAFAGGAYDADACRAYLHRAKGKGCLNNGCAARLACPVSQSYGRQSAQSAYHMRLFRLG